MHASHELCTTVTPENSTTSLQNVLRVLLSIKWQYMVPDTEVLTRAGIPRILTLLQKAQMRWAGLVTRMPDDRLLNSFCIVVSAMANDQMVGKRNASRTSKSVAFCILGDPYSIGPMPIFCGMKINCVWFQEDCAV